MSQVVEPGKKIPLVAQIECPPATPLYVRAEVLKDDRTPYTGSPVNLTNEGNGRFFNASLTMLDIPFTTATFRVYTDPTYTTESDDYCPVTEVYNRGANVDDINSKLDALLTQGQDVGLQGEIVPETTIEGDVSTKADELSGDVENESQATGEVEEITATGDVKDQSEITGRL